MSAKKSESTAESLTSADVAVATADQHDISQYRAGSGFHLSGFQ